MQHVTEAAHLHRLRSRLVRSPALTLSGLGRFDERIDAHLDGVRIAGAAGRALARQALERAGPGEVFVAMVGAIEDRDAVDIQRLCSVAEALPAARPGFLSALGWVSAAALRGQVTGWLSSDAMPWQREAGLRACAMHGVDPGRALDAALHAADPALRRAAMRVAGRSGRRDLLEVVRSAVTSEDAAERYEAARATLLLGDPDAAVAALSAIAVDPEHARRDAALSLALKVVPAAQARTLMAPLVHAPDRARTLIRHLGTAGDPHFVPWLIDRMAVPELARLAGEAFAWITGVDMVRQRLDEQPSGAAQRRPADAGDDEDDDLPRPDSERIRAWWQVQSGRFVPAMRHFMGEAPSVLSCRRVLETGGQRQRRAAAEQVVLLAPGTALFDTSAPAWRQRRLLAAAA